MCNASFCLAFALTLNRPKTALQAIVVISRAHFVQLAVSIDYALLKQYRILGHSPKFIAVWLAT